MHRRGLVECGCHFFGGRLRERQKAEGLGVRASDVGVCVRVCVPDVAERVGVCPCKTSPDLGPVR